MIWGRSSGEIELEKILKLNEANKPSKEQAKWIDEEVPSINDPTRPTVQNFLFCLTFPQYKDVPIEGIGKKGDAIAYIDNYTIFIKQPLDKKINEGDRCDIEFENFNEAPQKLFAWAKVIGAEYEK